MVDLFQPCRFDAAQLSKGRALDTCFLRAPCIFGSSTILQARGQRPGVLDGPLPFTWGMLPLPHLSRRKTAWKPPKNRTRCMFGQGIIKLVLQHSLATTIAVYKPVVLIPYQNTSINLIIKQFNQLKKLSVSLLLPASGS